MIATSTPAAADIDLEQAFAEEERDGLQRALKGRLYALLAIGLRMAEAWRRTPLGGPIELIEVLSRERLRGDTFSVLFKE